MTAGKVFFDLVAAQSPSYRGRGIARFSTDFLRAMVKHHPELVGAVVLHPELEMPQDLGELSDWVTTEPRFEEASVLHMSSVFEPEVPVRTFWPREAAQRGVLTVVTLYDLIPELFPGWYLEDPGLRRRWRCCREVVRVADGVLTLSECARQDTVTTLGVPADRVTVIGSAPSPVFRRNASRKAAFRVARSHVPGLKERFIVYNGAFNPRKNVDGLVKAYASLPRELVAAHQLVVVGEAPQLTRNHYLVMAKEMGIDGRLLITGFVPDEVLVSLYQSTSLSVYPSLYEGFGLPLVESMACGAPTIGGDNSSLVEILPRDACFKAEDPGAIAAAVTKGLTDEAFRARLAALAEREPPSWEEVADRAAGAFEELLEKAAVWRHRWRRQPELALVGVPKGLTKALAGSASCDSFEAPPEGAGETSGDLARGVLPWRALATLDPWRGGYDGAVFWVPALGPPGVEAVERFMATWPGRAVAVAGEPARKGEERKLSKLLSKLKRAGAEVVAPISPAEEAARSVLEAVRAPR